MLDLGWSEILVVGAIAVIVVGPKEMPKVVRAISNTFSKIRNASNDFRDAMHDIADESDVNDIMEEFKKSEEYLEKTIAETNKNINKITKTKNKKKK